MRTLLWFITDLSYYFAEDPNLIFKYSKFDYNSKDFINLGFEKTDNKLIIDEIKSFKPDLNHIRCPKAKKNPDWKEGETILVDPGHGYLDSGFEKGSLKESEQTGLIAQALINNLKPEVGYEFTREGDYNTINLPRKTNIEL